MVFGTAPSTAALLSRPNLLGWSCTANRCGWQATAAEHNRAALARQAVKKAGKPRQVRFVRLSYKRLLWDSAIHPLLTRPNTP